MIPKGPGNTLQERFVVIRTLNTGHDPNYGNLLQAWALRRVLLDLGHDSAIDSSPRSPLRVRRLARLKSLVVRHSVRAAPRLVPESWWRRESLGDLAAPQRSFIDKYLPNVALTSEHGVLNSEVADRATAFVIGSDQVWRPRYADPPSMLLTSLDKNDVRPRFSYSASFGRSDIEEWTPGYIAQTRPLAQRLDGVSVRESSGIEVAKVLWNVKAVQHVDPTLLIPADEYRAIAGDASSCAPPGGLIDYVLDQSSTALKTIRAIADVLGTEPTALMPRPAPSYQAFRQNPTHYQRPTVESWLATIAQAGFIVTDSFHGTIFSLLNKVPFLVLVNHERGAARFHSLLNLFGLEDRMVELGAPIDSELMSRPIDWARVDLEIVRERRRSLAYLQEMLALKR